jgi:hypothetical protein
MLFSGTRPRAASILAGGVAAFALTICHSIWNSYLWQDFESFSRTMAIGLTLTPFGAVAGYVVGCAVAGVFCVMGRLVAGQDDQATEDGPPHSAASSKNKLWEDRVWDVVGGLKPDRRQTKIRPVHAAAMIFLKLVVCVVVVFVAVAGFPSLVAIAFIIGLSLLASLVVVGSMLNDWWLNLMITVCAALLMLPAYFPASNLIVFGRRMSDWTDHFDGMFLLVTFAVLIGFCVAAAASWLAWLASRAGLASPRRLRRWFSVAGLFAIGLLSLVTWRIIDNTRNSSPQRTLARVVELGGYVVYTQSGWFNFGTPIRVDVTGSKLGNDELRSLASLPSLQSLFTADSSIDDHATSALREFPRLCHLSLAGSKITDDTLKHIGRLSALVWLNLENTQVTDRELNELGRLPNLNSLNLMSTGVTDEGLRHVARLPSLGWLNVSDCRVTDAGLQYLADMPWLSSLDLSGTEITDRGLEQLIRLSQLKHLELSNTAITDQGLANLAKLPNLSFLNLSNTAVTDHGLEPLINVRRVDLTGTDVTKQAADRFMTANPDCALTTDDD